MAQIYEAMFLLDNQVVRENWGKAKAIVTDTLEKHGATILTARRWDERKLAYRIKGRRRATYLLVHYEIPPAELTGLERDFNLNENVLRYLLLAIDAVPEEERALSEAENAADFVIPAPPPDDAPDEEEVRDDSDEDDSYSDRTRDSRRERGSSSEGGERDEEGEKADKGEKAPAPSAEGESAGTATEPAGAGGETEPVGAGSDTKAVDGADGSKEH